MTNEYQEQRNLRLTCLRTVKAHLSNRLTDPRYENAINHLCKSNVQSNSFFLLFFFFFQISPGIKSSALGIHSAFFQMLHSQLFFSLFSFFSNFITPFPLLLLTYFNFLVFLFFVVSLQFIFLVLFLSLFSHFQFQSPKVFFCKQLKVNVQFTAKSECQKILY